MTSLAPHIGAANRGESDVELRFARMLRQVEPPDINPDLGPCIIHLGADNGNGYVQFRYDGKNGYAHRYAWERVNGPIPDGLTIDHLCEVKRCVNVAHFVLAEGVDNYRRTALARSTCHKGHPYTPENTGHKNGVRFCITCKRATSRRGWERRARLANGLPDRRARYDQAKVRAVIAEIRRAELTIAQGAREIGCNPNYLGRRVWRETRQAVLERDGGQCQVCGGVATDAHHRQPRGSGGASNPLIAFGMANLLSLCRTCHGVVESDRMRAYNEGLLLRRPQVAEDVPVHTHNGWVLLDNEGGITPAPDFFDTVNSRPEEPF